MAPRKTLSQASLSVRSWSSEGWETSSIVMSHAGPDTSLAFMFHFIAFGSTECCKSILAASCRQFLAVQRPTAGAS